MNIPEDPRAGEARVFVPAFSTIRPEMLMWLGDEELETRFPSSARSARPFYFARNAIWRIGRGRAARQWPARWNA